MAQRLDILFPPGRVVAGNLYNPRTQDMDGNALVYKSGDKKGQPRVEYYFAVAIPKKPGEQHWAQTEWGQKVYQFGAQAMPQLYQAPTFAWKIKDGDSQIPNRRGKKPVEQPGHAGHWVVSFSGSYAPRIYNRDGTQAMPEPDAVKPGYWVQVFGNVDSNDSSQQPGIYINHSMVAFQAYGEEIVVGPDATAVGFGQAALPAGASATPVGAMVAPPVLAAPPAVPVVPPPVAVQPNPSFLAPGAVPPAMPVPPAVPVPVVPPAPPARQMTAKANGLTYEQMIGGGWSDQMLIAQGYMLP